MKKYTSILVASMLLNISAVSATTPVVGGFYRQRSMIENIIDYFARYALTYLLLSQFVFTGYLICLLYRMYVSKAVVYSGVIKWLVTIFSVLYLVAIALVAATFLYNFFNPAYY